MADVVDVANDHADYMLSIALHRARSVSTAVSAFDCDDCGEPIPESRRVAAPGCVACVECQSFRERRG